MLKLVIIMSLTYPVFSLECYTCSWSSGPQSNPNARHPNQRSQPKLLGEDCGDSYVGRTVDCPDQKCIIGYTLDNVNGQETRTRGCATRDAAPGCHQNTENNVYVETCVCEDDLCNESFDTAGSSSAVISWTLMATLLSMYSQNFKHYS